MSTTNLPAADAVNRPSGDAITLVFGDNSQVQMSKSFATKLDKEMDYLSEKAEQLEDQRYTATDAYYDRVGNAADMMNRASVTSYRDNAFSLDDKGTDYMDDLAALFTTQQRRAVDGGSNGDASKIKFFADGFRQAYDKATAPVTTRTDSTSSAPKDMDMSGVKELLAEVKTTQNSSAKSSKLSEAIAALIAQIRGTATKTEANPLQTKIDDLAETIGGQKAAKTTAAEKAADTPPPPAPTARKWQPSVSYSAGDSLTVEMKNAKGEWTEVDTKAKGNGKQGNGSLAPIEAGMTPEVRLRNNSTGQIIDASSQQMRTTKQEDGTVIVQFEDRKNGDNDFNDAVVTLRPGAPVSSEQRAAKTDATSETTDASAALADFDVTQLLDLLQALSSSISLINSSKNLSKADADALFEKIGGVVETIANALDASGEGGAAVTPEEVASILETVGGLNADIEAKIDDSGEKNDVLDALAMGVGKVADEMA
ncbi:DUF4114 domain-containing protein [Yoonia vestfoldensis]|uniref:DUF4114 domain-containing protein n=1 Tax=Yoonia vestfoldensis TaxID=245188 RepID=UPI000367F57B|nr:DUF4114 domain-containing protein [Yoonia vestfoldensis]